MNPTILSPFIGKILEQTELLCLDMTTSLGEGKVCIKTCLNLQKKMTLCRILLE